MSGRIQNGVRAVWQSLALALPIGLAGGVVGTAFHIAVEQVTALRAAQGWLLWLLPIAGLGDHSAVSGAAVPGPWHRRRIAHGAAGQAPAAGLDTRHLSGRCADPPVRRLCRTGGRCPANGRQYRLDHWQLGKAVARRAAVRRRVRHGSAVLGAVRHTDGLGTLCSDRGAGGGQLCPGAGAQPGGCTRSPAAYPLPPASPPLRSGWSCRP